MNCVHKYIVTYDSIGLLVHKGVVAVERRGPFHIHLCIHIHLISYVHKYTYIYDGIGLLVLKGVVVFERGSTPFPSLSP